MNPRSGVPILLVALIACELTEVTVAPGEATVVVQAVIGRNRSHPQRVLVEYSETGDGTGGHIPNAVVTIERLGGGRCDGDIDTLPEAIDTLVAAFDRDVVIAIDRSYVWERYCSFTTGERLGLVVATPAGEVVTGTLTMPGAAAWHVAVGDQETTFPYGVFTLDRLRDTLRLAVDAVSGRALQVEVRRPTPGGDEAVVWLHLDSLGVSLPGTLADPFEGAGEAIFKAGVTYTLTAALTDTNYYDFVRTFSDPLTGRGFRNHLHGGIGVFGAVETAQWALRVVQGEPAADGYGLRGVPTADGAPFEVHVSRGAASGTLTMARLP